MTSLPVAGSWVKKGYKLFSLSHSRLLNDTMSLTGIAGYCRAWLPDYAEVVQSLADLIYGHKMAMIDKIKWTPEGLTALTRQTTHDYFSLFGAP